MLACGRSAAVTTALARGCNTAAACCGLEHNRYVASTGLLDKNPNTAVADMLARGSRSTTTAVTTCNCSTAAASILNPGNYAAMTSVLAGGRSLAAVLAGDRSLAAVPAGGHSTAAPGILGQGRYTAAGGGHCTALVNLLGWRRLSAVACMLAQDR
jgi:hypothetical protein